MQADLVVKEGVEGGGVRFLGIPTSIDSVIKDLFCGIVSSS